MDIAIPIEHFDEFLTYAKKDLPEHYEVYTCKAHSQYICTFAKIVDKRTTFIKKNFLGTKDNYRGVFLDVMPLSSVPNGYAANIFYKSIFTLLRFNVLRRKPFKEADGFISKVVWTIIHALPYNIFSSFYFHVIRKYPVSNSKNVCFAWSFSLERRTFPHSYFENSVLKPFETDQYLCKEFGEYMKLPPENEQISKHNSFIGLERPYSYYQDHEEEIVI